MQEDLRKVMFQPGYCNGFDPDWTEEERQEEYERTRRREGCFHKWVEEQDICPQTGNPYTKTLALVEDADTGQMYKVEPELITFVK